MLSNGGTGDSTDSGSEDYVSGGESGNEYERFLSQFLDPDGWSPHKRTLTMCADPRRRHSRRLTFQPYPQPYLQPSYLYCFHGLVPVVAPLYRTKWYGRQCGIVVTIVGCHRIDRRFEPGLWQCSPPPASPDWGLGPLPLLHLLFSHRFSHTGQHQINGARPRRKRKKTCPATCSSAPHHRPPTMGGCHPTRCLPLPEPPRRMSGDPSSGVRTWDQRR